jgi:hypothetical protein
VYQQNKQKITGAEQSAEIDPPKYGCLIFNKGAKVKQ